MVVHVGFPKTGTTFLQQIIFPSIEGYQFIPSKKSKNCLFDLINHDDIDYNPESIKRQINDLSDNTRRELFLSYENTVGKALYFYGNNRYRTARRLKEIGCRSIIISIRNQKDIIDSHYRYYIQSGGVLSLKDYLDLNYKKELHSMRWNFFCYYHLIYYYKNLFGSENVFVLLQEELKNHTDLSTKKMAQFLGKNRTVIQELNMLETKNVSLPNLPIKILRLINHFTYNKFKPSQMISNRISTWKFLFLLKKCTDWHIFKKHNLLDENNLSSIIKQYYQWDNKKLQELYDLDLEKYNYPLP